MTTPVNDARPAWVCQACADKHLGPPVVLTTHKWRGGICGFCHQEQLVTACDGFAPAKSQSSTHRYPFATCGACGWLHVVMPVGDARKAVADFNSARAKGNWPDRLATYERYLRCHRCGASTDQFVEAVESDARHGATLHACVIESASFGGSDASGKVAPMGVPAAAPAGSTVGVKTRPILFLDLDDVLCLNEPYGGYDLIAPGKPADLYKKLFEGGPVRRLNEILDRASPQVVMTTSWLRFLDRTGFEQLFSQTGLLAVVGAFHEHWEAPQNYGETRLQAVERWLEQHHRGEPYAVLDDHLSGTDLAASVHDLLNRVILCDENVGLLDEQRDGVLAALTRPFVQLQRSR